MESKRAILDPRGLLERAGVELTYADYEEPSPIWIRCTFVQAGVSHFARPASYFHPSPVVSRLFLLRSGSAYITGECGKGTLREGKIYLLPAERGFHVHYEPCDLFFYHLRLHDRLGLPLLRSVSGFLELDDQSLHRDILNGFDKDRPTERPLRAFEAVVDLCFSVVTDLRKQSAEDLTLGPMFEYIRANASPRLTVEDLAIRYGFSRSTLSRLFHKAEGMPVKTYIMRTYMRKARELLIYSRKTVSEIAFEIGYDDPSYFHHVFRRHSGFTPRQYRTRSRHGEDMS